MALHLLGLQNKQRHDKCIFSPLEKKLRSFPQELNCLVLSQLKCCHWSLLSKPRTLDLSLSVDYFYGTQRLSSITPPFDYVQRGNFVDFQVKMSIIYYIVLIWSAVFSKVISAYSICANKMSTKRCPKQITKCMFSALDLPWILCRYVKQYVSSLTCH